MVCRRAACAPPDGQTSTCEEVCHRSVRTIILLRTDPTDLWEEGCRLPVQSAQAPCASRQQDIAQDTISAKIMMHHPSVVFAAARHHCRGTNLPPRHRRATLCSAVCYALQYLDSATPQRVPYRSAHCACVVPFSMLCRAEQYFFRRSISTHDRILGCGPPFSATAQSSRRPRRGPDLLRAPAGRTRGCGQRVRIASSNRESRTSGFESRVWVCGNVCVESGN
jgi:hypothetical protein